MFQPNTVKIFLHWSPSGGWFTQHSLEVRGNDLKLCQGRFRLDTGKKFSLTEWSGIGISCCVFLCLPWDVLSCPGDITTALKASTPASSRPFPLLLLLIDQYYIHIGAQRNFAAFTVPSWNRNNSMLNHVIQKNSQPWVRLG